MSKGYCRVEYTFFDGVDYGRHYRFELRERVNSHQLAILDVAYSQHSAPEQLTPVLINWSYSTADKGRDFYGYVNHTETISGAPGHKPMTRIYMLGSSRPMNNPNPQSWTRVTGSFIARSVAAQYGLRCVVHNTRTLLPFWSTGISTDFRGMVNLANYYGFYFWVDGSTLYFVDPLLLLRSVNTTPVVTLTQDYFNSDTLVSMHTIDGPLSGVAENSAVVQTVLGVDQTSKRLIRSSSANLVEQNLLPVSPNTEIAPLTVNSLDLAVRTNQANLSTATWSTMQAEANPTGMVGLGTLVDIEGRGVADTQQGVWVVNEVNHVIAQINPQDAWASYVIEFSARRNRVSDTVFQRTTTMNNALGTVPAVLRNNVWESSTLGDVYV